MSEEILKDLITLLWSCAVGVGLCIFYEILKSVRLSFKLPTAITITLDILFSIISAVVTFCLALVRCNGYIRGYVIFGEIVGFIALRLLSFGVIHKIFSVIFSIINRIVLRISTVFHRVSDSLFNKIIKSFVILKKQLRSLLQMMYNHIGEKYKRKRRAKDDRKNKTHNDIKTKSPTAKTHKARKEKSKKRG